MAQREELILEVTAKLEQAQRDIQALQEQLTQIATPTEATVTVAVDGQDNVEVLAETTEELDGTAAEVTVEAEDDATDSLEDVEDTLGDLDGETVEVAVEADTEAATSGLDDVVGGLEDVTAAGGGLKALSGAGGIGGLTTALLGAASAGIEFTNSVEQLALASGASYEESSKLLAVLQDYTSIDASRLESSIGRIADKIASQPDLAAKLNIDTALGPLDQFIQAVDTLNSGQLTATERIQTGIDLFGRGGMKVVNEIAASLSGPLASAMDEIGEKRIIDADDIARADELEASMGKLKGQINELSVALGEKLVPALVLFADLAGSGVVSGALETGLGKLLGPLAQIEYGLDRVRAQMGDTNDEFDEFSGGEFASEIDVAAASVEDINAAMQKQGQTSREVAGWWEQLITWTQRGQTGIGSYTNTWNLLRDELKLTDEALAELLQQKVEEKLAADEQAALDFAAAEEEAAAKAAELAAELSLVNDELSSGESRADGMAAAFDRIDAGRLTEGLEIAGFVDDLDDLGEAVDELDVDKLNLGEIDLVPPSDDWQAWLNMPDEAQTVLDKMSTFRDSIETEMTQAFAGGGPQGVRDWAARTRQAVVDELNAAGVDSQAAINQILEGLGLLPEQVETTITISEDEQVLSVIDRVVSGLGEIPPQVAANIAMAVNNKDPDTAMRILNDHLVSIGQEPISLSIEADPAPATDTIEDVETGDYQATVNADADTQEAARQLLAETTRQRTAKIYAVADATAADTRLDAVANQYRSADIYAVAHTAGANADLNSVARDRYADVYIRTHGTAAATAAATPTTTGPTATTMAATPAATTMMQPVSVTINAGVIGDRFAVQRAVTRALRQSQRLNGRRVA